MLKKETFKLKAPISIGIITTNKCNLRCLHCMNESTLNEPDGLSTNDIKKSGINPD